MVHSTALEVSRLKGRKDRGVAAGGWSLIDERAVEAAELSRTTDELDPVRKGEAEKSWGSEAWKRRWAVVTDILSEVRLRAVE